MRGRTSLRAPRTRSCLVAGHCRWFSKPPVSAIADGYCGEFSRSRFPSPTPRFVFFGSPRVMYHQDLSHPPPFCVSLSRKINYPSTWTLTFCISKSRCNRMFRSHPSPPLIFPHSRMMCEPSVPARNLRVAFTCLSGVSKVVHLNAMRR